MNLGYVCGVVYMKVVRAEGDEAGRKVDQRSTQQEQPREETTQEEGDIESNVRDNGGQLPRGGQLICPNRA